MIEFHIDFGILGFSSLLTKDKLVPGTKSSLCNQRQSIAFPFCCVFFPFFVYFSFYHYFPNFHVMRGAVESY